MKRILLLAVLFAILGHGDCGKRKCDRKEAKTLAPRDNICTRICTRKCFSDTCSYVWKAATSWCSRRAPPNVESNKGPDTKKKTKGKQKSKKQKKKDEGAANAVEELETALRTCPPWKKELVDSIQKVKSFAQLSDRGKKILKQGQKSLKILEATEKLDEATKELYAACETQKTGPTYLDVLEAELAKADKVLDEATKARVETSVYKKLIQTCKNGLNYKRKQNEQENTKTKTSSKGQQTKDHSPKTTVTTTAASQPTNKYTVQYAGRIGKQLKDGSIGLSPEALFKLKKFIDGVEAGRHPRTVCAEVAQGGQKNCKMYNDGRNAMEFYLTYGGTGERAIFTVDKNTDICTILYAGAHPNAKKNN